VTVRHSRRTLGWFWNLVLVPAGADVGNIDNDESSSILNETRFFIIVMVIRNNRSPLFRRFFFGAIFEL